ncbi:MAG: hypothetical protein ACOCV1_06905 [Bacillota bacterium]
MNIKPGDKVIIKTYREVVNEYPDKNWYENFFIYNANKKRKVLKIDERMGIVSCMVMPPWDGYPKTEKTLGVDIRAVKKISQLELDDNLFEI